MRKTHQLILIGMAVLTLSGSMLAVGGQGAKAEQASDRKAAALQVAEDRREQIQARLNDVKLKACQKRETAINNIMERIADRGQRQMDVFNKIAERTEAFYASKGKTLSNYDALVADVNAKKTAAQTVVNEIKASSVSFKCDGTDPKGAADSFKVSLKAEIAALKDYRTSVRNLIVGVKSAQGESTDDKTEGVQ